MTRSIARGSRSGPSPRTTTAASTSALRAASPQRSEAPGPRSQSAHWTVRASVSTSCAPRTTTTSSTELARTRSNTGSSSSRCFGEPKRVEAPSARTTAAIMLGGDDDAAHDDPPRRLFVLRIAETADPLDDVEAACDLAEQCVVGREAGVRARDDEELATGGPGRLGSRLCHRDDAARVARISRRGVDDGIARPAASVPVRIATLDHEARDDPVEREPVVEVIAGE